MKNIISTIVEPIVYNSMFSPELISGDGYMLVGWALLLFPLLFVFIYYFLYDPIRGTLIHFGIAMLVIGIFVGGTVFGILGSELAEYFADPNSYDGIYSYAIQFCLLLFFYSTIISIVFSLGIKRISIHNVNKPI
jgi:hypothetical protein